MVQHNLNLSSQPWLWERERIFSVLVTTTALVLLDLRACTADSKNTYTWWRRCAVSNKMAIRALVAAGCLYGSTHGVRVTIDNTVPRLTTNNIILDGHDGRIQKFTPGGPYYYHALSYGNCSEPDGLGCNQTPDKCGFRMDHNISVFTSRNLSSGSWEYVSNAIDMTLRPAGTVFRPDVVYNNNTKLYVMWWNWVSAAGQYMGYASSTSPNPEGPFTLVQEVVPLTHSNATYHAGDWHFFVDDTTGIGYVIYCAEYYCWIDELTPDYLGTTGRFVGPLGNLYFVEAPAMFRVGPTYYALFDHCCCFCFQGSGIKVFTAPHPLGPWMQQPGADDLACNTPAQLMRTTPLLPWDSMPGQPRAAAAAAPDATSAITVVDASFGANCNASLSGRMTAEVGAFCNGKPDCGYQVREAAVLLLPRRCVERVNIASRRLKRVGSGSINPSVLSFRHCRCAFAAQTRANRTLPRACPTLIWAARRRLA